MSTFSKKVEREVSLKECDLCGRRQKHEAGEPVMFEFAFSETVEGSHGHDYTRMRVLHLCKHGCYDRVGQIIVILNTKRQSTEVAKKHFGECMKLLAKLLDEP